MMLMAIGTVGSAGALSGLLRAIPAPASDNPLSGVPSCPESCGATSVYAVMPCPLQGVKHGTIDSRANPVMLEMEW